MVEHHIHFQTLNILPWQVLLVLVYKKILIQLDHAINKDIDKTVADRVRNDQSILPDDRTTLIASEKNTETKDPVPPPSGPTPTDGDRRTEPGPQPAQAQLKVYLIMQKTRENFPGARGPC